MNASTLKIYLADLVYDSIESNFTVPLNVGYIASFIKYRYASEVDIEIFKYPKELEQALLDKSPPHVVGLSNYSWNAKLNLAFLDIIKSVNRGIVTIMGGPDIRTDPKDLRNFLLNRGNLDYYVVQEGEGPFSGLVEKFLQNPNSRPLNIPGCARVEDGLLHYVPIEYNKQPQKIEQPSPYLSGSLDRFISNPQMIPLLETNRGCPFGCAYCAWGVATLTKLRVRPMEDVLAEIDYIAEKSAGQSRWIFCDANFGILARDIEISEKIRRVMDIKKFPSQVTLWHSKNTSDRNIEIVKNIGGMHKGYVALQSTDPEVLKNVGRGAIKVNEFKKTINHYREQKIPVATDLLIGLPGESAKSHFDSICECFDLGFDAINIYNIRMLTGTRYDTPEWRDKYGVVTKYRPIYGSYGIYGGKKIFELEESIRATNSMSERELDDFKILHSLIGFAWNSGYFKYILKYAQHLEVNPGIILNRLIGSKKPILENLFDELRRDSMGEWFDTQDEMISYFNKEENFNDLTKNFMKLYMLFIARIFQRHDIIHSVEDELCNIIKNELIKANRFDEDVLDSLRSFSHKISCADLLQEPFVVREELSGKIAAIIFNRPELNEEKSVTLEIYRTQQMVDFCYSFFQVDSERGKGLPLHSLVRFLEAGGISALTNNFRILEAESHEDRQAAV